jgi:RNA polymerase sigma-70 factor (ECF subfamily)
MDDLQQVREFRSSEAPPANRARDAARSALADAITAEAGAAKQVRRRRRPRVRVLAVVAIPLAAVIVVAVFSLSSSPVGATPAAAALNRLAHLIATQSLTVRPGQYLYVDSANDWPRFAAMRGGGYCQTVATEHRKIWIGADGSGLIRSTVGPEHFASNAARAVCLEANANWPLQSASTTNEWFAPQCLELGPGNGDWNSLSTDPQTLLAQLRRQSGGPRGPENDFVNIRDALQETNAPPAIRAALYQAAALIPGVQLLGTVRDHDGRSGLGIAWRSDDGTFELIFDPQTGELLAEEGTNPDYWDVYQPEQVVNALPGTPPAPLTPACDHGGGVFRDVPGGSVMTGSS